MTKKAASTATPITPPSRRLELHAVEGKSADALMADAMAKPYIDNASIIVDFARQSLGEMDLSETVRSLKESSAAVKAGDLGNPEALLTSQAIALNAIFGALARRSAQQISGGYLEAGEKYLRLALKAQSQSRATVETLAAIKNPPVVYARQANITNGPQQVNNHALPAGAQNDIVTPTKLLESGNGEWLDTGATTPTIGSHPAMEAVGTLDRPKDG